MTKSECEKKLEEYSDLQEKTLEHVNGSHRIEINDINCIQNVDDANDYHIVCKYTRLNVEHASGDGISDIGYILKNYKEV